MQRKLDQWTTALAVVAIVGALLACKKKTPGTTTPSAEAPAAAPTPLAPTAVASAQPALPEATELKVGEVKRYADREKPQTGAVRVLADDVKVFNEADDKTAEVATLSKGLLVFRLASVPDYELVEYPSGVGKVSPGWVLAKFIDPQATSGAQRSAVAAQSTQAAVKPPAAKPSASTAKPSASAAASAKAAADKAAADKAAADKAAAEKAAADKAAADKLAAERAAARAERLAKRAAERAKKAAEAAAAGQ